MGALILIPVARNLYLQLNNVIEGLKTNARTGPTGESQLFYQQIITQFIELLRVLKFSPVLPLIAIGALIRKRETALLLALLSSISLMLCTVVYINRVQYLLPYFIVLAATFYQCSFQELKPFAYLLKNKGLVALLCWSFALSLCVRTMLALNKSMERDRELVTSAAESMIGKGNYKVLTIPCEFYYSGRSLGWKMYKPYLAQNEPLSAEELKLILPHVDYVITNHLSDMSPEFVQELNREGMQDRGDYYVYHKPIPEFNGITTNIVRVRNLYSIFRQPYGPYRLYVRGATVANKN